VNGRLGLRLELALIVRELFATEALRAEFSVLGGLAHLRLHLHLHSLVPAETLGVDPGHFHRGQRISHDMVGCLVTIENCVQDFDGQQKPSTAYLSHSILLILIVYRPSAYAKVWQLGEMGISLVLTYVQYVKAADITSIDAMVH